MKTTLFLIISLLIFGCSTRNQQKMKFSKNDFYSEKYRPQFHFSPDSMWMNDPNGMVYYDDEYHLFYQYYPDSTVWGTMHWGHAISTDLVHWEHQPVALYPDKHGYIFSGSAVVDWNNTSGLGENGEPPLIAIFTYHDPEREKSGEIDFQTQGIAYSNDKGRTWNKYQENPVLKNPGIRDFRDPKVMWYSPSEKWIMTLAVKDHIEFYSSPNLIDWQKESEFGKEVGAHGGVWECPDLIQMEVQGTREKQWVLLVSINPGGPNGGSATQYFVGEFDGSKFTTSQTETKWLDYGRDNYAGVTWSDVSDEDGRHLFIGWMSNWNYATVVPTEEWRSAMTLPRELELKHSDGEYLVASVPVNELTKLRNENVEISSQVISGNLQVDAKQIPLNQSEMVFEFQMQNGSQFGMSEEFGVSFSNKEGEILKVGCRPGETTFFTDRSKAGESGFSDNFAGVHTAPYKIGQNMKLHIFMDAASIEVFVDNGNLIMTDIVFPTAPYTSLKIYTKNGNVKLDKAQLWSLKSVW